MKLLALVAGGIGGVAMASTALGSAPKMLAQSTDEGKTFLPFVASSLSPTATLPPTPTPTATPTPTPGASATFVDGPGGDVNTATDVLMSSNWHSRNGGQHADFQLEGLPGTIQHALLLFDLSSLPAVATCTAAKLYLYHSYPPEYAGLNSGQVHRLTAANWPWIEGSGDIDPAQQGEPCWDAREADGSGGVQTPWAGSAGCSTPGVDYETEPLGTWAFRSDSPQGTEVVMDLDPARVQEWFGNPNANYGLILIADDNVPGVHVGSAEHTNPAYRPKLVVTYQPP